MSITSQIKSELGEATCLGIGLSFLEDEGVGIELPCGHQNFSDNTRSSGEVAGRARGNGAGDGDGGERERPWLTMERSRWAVGGWLCFVEEKEGGMGIL